MKTQEGLRRQTFWRIALAAWLRPYIFYNPLILVLCPILLLAPVSVSRWLAAIFVALITFVIALLWKFRPARAGIMFFLDDVLDLGLPMVASILVWTSSPLVYRSFLAAVLLIAALRLPLIARTLARRVTAFEAMQCGEIVYLDGVERCLSRALLQDYCAAVGSVSYELGVPVQRQTLVIYEVPKVLPWASREWYFARRLRCICIRLDYRMMKKDGAANIGVLKVGLAGYARSIEPWLERGAKWSSLGDEWPTAVALYWTSARSDTPYVQLAARWDVYNRVPLESILRRDKRKDDRSVHWQRAVFFAFVAQAKGLRSLVQCLLEAKPDEAASVACLENLFGSIEELARRWEEKLQQARSSPECEQERAEDYFYRLCSEQSKQDALTWSLSTLEAHPNWRDLAMEALVTALSVRDAETGLQLMPYLFAGTSGTCAHTWLTLLQALLFDIAGQRDKAISGYEEVLRSECATLLWHATAKKYLNVEPANAGLIWHTIQLELF